jgi:hypothetical protein
MRQVGARPEPRPSCWVPDASLTPAGRHHPPSQERRSRPRGEASGVPLSRLTSLLAGAGHGLSGVGAPENGVCLETQWRGCRRRSYRNERTAASECSVALGGSAACDRPPRLSDWRFHSGSFDQACPHLRPRPRASAVCGDESGNTGPLSESRHSGCGHRADGGVRGAVGWMVTASGATLRRRSQGVPQRHARG